MSCCPVSRHVDIVDDDVRGPLLAADMDAMKSDLGDGQVGHRDVRRIDENGLQTIFHAMASDHYAGPPPLLAAQD